MPGAVVDKNDPELAVAAELLRVCAQDLVEENGETRHHPQALVAASGGGLRLGRPGERRRDRHLLDRSGKERLADFGLPRRGLCPKRYAT